MLFRRAKYVFLLIILADHRHRPYAPPKISLYKMYLAKASLALIVPAPQMLWYRFPIIFML